MEAQETKSASGYDKPPWIFKGRALYQLHLVKAETARAFVPKEFRLVEAFGYTLGGFFLASYDDSPAGIFDEDVGLPSQVARFSKSITASTRTTKSKISGVLSSIGIHTASYSPKSGIDIQVTEIDGPAATGICNIALTSTVPKLNWDEWMGPLIKMSLPSFSGRTEYNPHLLKYSCQIQCRVRPISPAKVLGPSTLETDGEHSFDSKSLKTVNCTTGDDTESKRDLGISVMLSKPILALEFNCLKMLVEPPIIVSEGSHNSTENSL